MDEGIDVDELERDSEALEKKAKALQKEGYREGISAREEESLQEGFDAAYKEMFDAAFDLGEIRGMILFVETYLQSPKVEAWKVTLDKLQEKLKSASPSQPLQEVTDAITALKAEIHHELVDCWISRSSSTSTLHYLLDVMLVDYPTYWMSNPVLELKVVEGSHHTSVMIEPEEERESMRMAEDWQKNDAKLCLSSAFAKLTPALIPAPRVIYFAHDIIMPSRDEELCDFWHDSLIKLVTLHPPVSSGMREYYTRAFFPSSRKETFLWELLKDNLESLLNDSKSVRKPVSKLGSTSCLQTLQQKKAFILLNFVTRVLALDFRYKVEPIESTLAYQTFFQKSSGSYRGTASKSLLGLYAKTFTREMPGSEFLLFQTLFTLMSECQRRGLSRDELATQGICYPLAVELFSEMHHNLDSKSLHRALRNLQPVWLALMVISLALQDAIRVINISPFSSPQEVLGAMSCLVSECEKQAKTGRCRVSTKDLIQSVLFFCHFLKMYLQFHPASSSALRKGQSSSGESLRDLADKIINYTAVLKSLDGASLTYIHSILIACTIKF
ncbi:unnamed protein product [Darwinula stevensoni]|uniref:Essential protein Yae1 N-terminal domain-containing protein n=1 Tax=Darwinula stevensoni TaxID=69355 RepID=A0A7R9A6Q4_9CRUS|nr:unnamed protein product [Darwinula stevensoni]CAG0890007.1 unnamed protein product [Darwinula stevensoni]